jgi:FixJ family two-component response regulator
MKLGAIDFIQKPFSPAEILEVARVVVPRNNRNEGPDAT